MKKQLLFSALALVAILFNLKAQTISTFENITIPTDSFIDGKYQLTMGGFTSGNAYFTNAYDTSFGGYWSSGFLISNKRDSSTNSSVTGFDKLRTAITGKGYAGSANYAVGQQYAMIRITGNAKGKQLQGMYVTNSNYSVLSMLYGDLFAKKFGGAGGNDPDWFKLTVRGFLNGNNVADTVEMMLADFRFSDNSKDYILKSWKFLDLTKLGNVDSIELQVSSSDNSGGVINTPAFFCIDNFSTRDIKTVVQNATANDDMISFYPNPSNGIFKIMGLNLTDKISIYDINGSMVAATIASEEINLSYLPKGLYIAEVHSLNGISRKRIVIE
jgi:hypothetical protein